MMEVYLLLTKNFDLLLIKNDYNAGFSRAVNQGYKHSKGKYLFILNPDTCLIEDSIGKLLKKLKKYLMLEQLDLH